MEHHHHLGDEEVVLPLPLTFGGKHESETVDAQNCRPFMVLTSPDPSAKKRDEVLGADLGLEMELKATLLPPNLPPGGSKGLANVMVDATA